MTFSGNVRNGTRNKCLNFGGDPYMLSLVTTFAVCLGGGLRSLSAFLVFCVLPICAEPTKSMNICDMMLQ